MAKDYFPIDENPETSLRACAFFLAQDLGEPKAQAEILTRIVGHYLAAGELDLAAQALEPLYDVSDSHEREQRFAELAAVAASAGHDDFAVSLAEACEDFTWADAARHDAALAQAERGDYAAARAMVAPLAYPEPSLVEVARFAAEKDEAQALSIAADIEEPRARAVVLLEVAARRAAAGRGADALNLLLATETVLPQIDLPDEHLDALCTLGTRYAALERREKALQLLAQAQAIAEDAADDNMLLRVADSYLAMGDTDRALYVAEEIDAFDISWFYANIAHAQARAGDFASARKLLATLKEDQHQGRGCLFLARAYQENGDEANFQAQLARALALARDTRV